MTRVASVIAVILTLATACASATSGTVIPVSDVKSLSGRWLGYATGTGAGAPNPIELTISPDATYTSRIGAQLQHGTVSVSDGKVSFSRQGASAGSSTVFAASTAVLEARGGLEPPNRGFADLSLSLLGTAPWPE